jgi:peptidoglycan hydrolase CwlO-like protein
VADTKTELSNARDQLHQLELQISDKQALLEKVKRQGAALAAEFDRIQSAIAETQAEIARLQREIEKATDEMNGLQGQLDRRAWVAYESGPGSTFEFILGSTSLSDLSTRLEIVNRAVQSDRDLIDQVQDKRAELQTKQVAQQAAETKLRSQRTEVANKQAAVNAQADKIGAIVASLNSKRAKADRIVSSLHDKLVREQEAAKLAAQQQQQHTGGGTVTGHPFGVCPVPSGFYSDDFGAPRYGGGYHLHAGNDLFASAGAPILAPFSGTASDASNGLGGISVKVYGANGWVYNAHLTSIVRLGSVSAGTVIGLVGNSGDAQGGPTHDHFEWHPYAIPSPLWTSPYGVSQVGDAIDPYPYLNQVC